MLFSSLRDTLIKNMKSREKPSPTESNNTPSEPIKVIKSDAMKNMLAAMNKHFEKISESTEETVTVVECGSGPGVPPPPPPPPPVSGINTITKVNKEEAETSSDVVPPTMGIPPPPPPPPFPDFTQVPKKPKPVVKKPKPKPENNANSNSNPNPRPSLKDQLMRVSLKKIGK